MSKYSPAPKEIADAIRHSVAVSPEDALGEGWKNLRVDRAKTPSKRTRGLGTIRVSNKGNKRPTTVSLSRAFRHLKVGDMRVEIPAAAGEEFTSKLIHVLRDFLKHNSVRA